MEDTGQNRLSAPAGPTDSWLSKQSPTLPIVTEKCWAAAVVARNAGASVKQVIDCLWLGRADQERARLAVKRLQPDSTRSGDIRAEDALAKLASIRVVEVLKPVWDRYFAAVFALESTVEDLGRREADANAIIAELATVNRRLQELERVTLGAKSKAQLVKRADQLCGQLSEQLTHILAVLERISDLLAAMTTYTDVGLLQAGYTVHEILALGASPRSARSIYRRQGLPGRTKPSTRIDNAFVEAFAGAAEVFTPMVELYQEWTETIQNRLTALHQCRRDIPSAVNSRALAAVAQPIDSTR